MSFSNVNSNLFVDPNLQFNSFTQKNESSEIKAKDPVQNTFVTSSPSKFPRATGWMEKKLLQLPNPQTQISSEQLWKIQQQNPQIQNSMNQLIMLKHQHLLQQQLMLQQQKVQQQLLLTQQQQQRQFLESQLLQQLRQIQHSQQPQYHIYNNPVQAIILTQDDFNNLKRKRDESIIGEQDFIQNKKIRKED